MEHIKKNIFNYIFTFCLGGILLFNYNMWEDRKLQPERDKQKQEAFDQYRADQSEKWERNRRELDQFWVLISQNCVDIQVLKATK